MGFQSQVVWQWFQRPIYGVNLFRILFEIKNEMEYKNNNLYINLSMNKFYKFGSDF